MRLRKPWWVENSVGLNTEILLQIDGFNGGNWFNVPSTQSGIEFNIKCYDNCLRGLEISTSSQHKGILGGKLTNLKVRVL
jgi:hypothetical protein